jgi:hypothetical protein
MLSSFSELDEGLNNDTRHHSCNRKKTTAASKMTIRQGYVSATCHRADKRENANNAPQGMSPLFDNVSGGGVVVGGQHYVLTKKA